VINPAGWYPQPDGQQRYWDGQRWTGHRAQGISVVKRPAGVRRRWLRHHKVIVAAGVFILLGVSFGVADSFAEPEATIPVRAAPPAASAPPGQPDEKQPKLTEEGPKKGDFLGVVVGARDRYQGTSNEFKQELISRKRDKDLCALWPAKNLVVHDWTGKIKRLSVMNGGQGVLELEIGDGMTVRLGNDDMSSDTTRLPVRSDAYAHLAEKSDGDSVQFSGRFVEKRDTCLRDRGWDSQRMRMESPSFSFQFFRVE